MTTTTARDLASTLQAFLNKYLRGQWAALVQAQIDWPGPVLAEARMWACLPGEPFSITVEPLVLEIGTTLDDLALAVETAGYRIRRTSNGREAWRIVHDHRGPWLSLDVERAVS
jgi:hypothetical protein